MKWPGMQKWSNQGGVIVPKRLIKEEIDRQHRLDWEDPDRYQQQKQKALRYIEVRASQMDHFAWEKLVRETARVFHDDLAQDPDVRERAQRACWAAEQQWLHDRDLDVLPPAPAMAPEAPRGDVRGVDESDETLESLEWQQKEERDF